MNNLKQKLLNIINWIANDGLLHILSSSLILICLYSFHIKFYICLIITICIGLSKEVYDLVKKKNNIKQSLHDIICNVIGIIISVIVIVISIII